MALIAKRPNGTMDVTPNEAYKWHTVENVVKETAEQFGFKEIRIPTFEDTGLFVRGVGDTTDVVQKEMYTVSSTGDKTYTLRPEGTAGTVRAVLENGILNDGLPQKLFYILSCFRHEKAQKGRLREFHQFGCEMFGSPSPLADAEVISLAYSVITRLGLKNTELNINSIGCPECRAKYREALKAYFEPHRDELCDTCKERLDKNPMRLLDCKSKEDQEIAKDAPLITEYLCDECADHFGKVKEYLGLMGIEYKINPKIVRGLDYYTRTVFEFLTTDIGSQAAVCAGGRYDGLVESLGGKPTPALGFGMGLERIILTMESQGLDFAQDGGCELYIAPMGDKAAAYAAGLIAKLRDMGVYAEYDLIGRSLKAQMKYADKIGAKFVIVLGDNEIEQGKINVKKMATGEQTAFDVDDSFPERLSDFIMASLVEELDMEGLL
ncbi:MAG: histidine--tRNA ligase [Ruminococcus sp.]|nr:histidine--tRNA ligase [Ruminococcus sp.]